MAEGRSGSTVRCDSFPGAAGIFHLARSPPCPVGEGPARLNEANMADTLRVGTKTNCDSNRSSTMRPEGQYLNH